MTATSWLVLALAGTIAVVDWWAAETGRRTVEAVAKPAVIVLLAGVAVTLTTSSDLGRWLVLAALACSLVGDVALLRPDRAARFAAGLAAFLAAHIAYIAAMLLGLGAAAADTAVGIAAGPALAIAAAVIVGAGFGLVGQRILRAVQASGHAELVLPVAAYVGAISLMVVAAWSTGRPTALAGALAFYASDSLLGWDRFVGPVAHRSLLVMATYHVGQALLVLSLAG